MLLLIVGMLMLKGLEDKQPDWRVFEQKVVSLDSRALSQQAEE